MNIFGRCTAVVLSCETVGQIDTALNYILLVHKRRLLRGTVVQLLLEQLEARFRVLSGRRKGGRG